MDEDVQNFMAITGTDNDQVARGYLGVTNGDSMQAIQLFFENPDLASSFLASQNPPDVPPASSRPAAASRPSARSGRQDASGVIHIDSDDDQDDDATMEDFHDELDVDDDDDDDANTQGHGHIARVARNAQEEEDAAMARRLQEEMYGAGPGGPGGPGGDLADDGVRAPIGRTTETLAAPGPSWGLDDEDRDFAVLEQLRRRQQRAAPSRGAPGPFSQSVWDDPDAPPISRSTRPEGSEPSATSRRLADLFRPPFDILSRLSLDEARTLGKEDKKWIMVNLQDMEDFNCQTLNRDHWKNENIKSLIKEHFIFLQYDKNSHLANDYLTFYFPNQSHEDPDNFPHVAILDPRTGEQCKVWAGRPFPPPDDFYSEVVEFLDRYSLDKNSKNPVIQSKPKAKAVDYGKMTEEEMLEMAMKNSLETNAGPSGSKFQDPDELTKGKGRATDEAAGSSAADVPAAEESAFEGISSSQPHTEPEHNPATTTRIQFRHSGGRIIRRFSTGDTVRRIYEWLKAAPFEGKENVVFELKAMPAGRDLIEELDKTIEEAGLKQGTVMIEFLD